MVQVGKTGIKILHTPDTLQAGCPRQAAGSLQAIPFSGSGRTDFRKFLEVPEVRS
jgi:hypothetical protein